MKISPEAQDIIEKQYGYRTDAQSAVTLGSISPIDIINYEINDLGNDDIIDTINELYPNNLPAISDYPNEKTYYNDIPNQIDSFIKHQLNTDLYYLIWLVNDWRSCYSFYADFHIDPKTIRDVLPNGEIPFIDKYAVHSDALLVSDIGIDGQLFAMKNKPVAEPANYTAQKGLTNNAKTILHYS